MLLLIVPTTSPPAINAPAASNIAAITIAPASVMDYRDLAVISAIGTRAWYRGLGFQDGALDAVRADEDFDLLAEDLAREGGDLFRQAA